MYIFSHFQVIVELLVRKENRHCGLLLLCHLILMYCLSVMLDDISFTVEMIAVSLV